MVSNFQLSDAQAIANEEVVVLSYSDNEHELFSEGLCAIQRGELWGFMDTTGKVVIDFAFKSNGREIPEFKEGKCCVCLPTQAGDLRRIYIDKSGKALFANQSFSGITPFSGGMAIVEFTIGSKTPFLSFIDSLGKTVPNAVTPGYSNGMKLEFRGFHEGLAAVCDARSKAWGYINFKGKWAIMPDLKFKTVGDFHNGLAFVQESSEGKWGAIDTKGALIIPFTHINRPGDFSDGLSAVKNEQDKVGYMDKNGNLIIPFLYDPLFNQNGLPFFEGNAIVGRGDSYYSISLTGKENLKVGESNAEIWMMQNGLIALKKWTKSDVWGIGLIRTNGEVVFYPGSIYQLGEFRNGLAYARAKINGINCSGFIKLDSNFVILNQNP